MKLKRVSVIGGSGSGKTVLTNNLNRILNVPVYHLDALNYDANWVEVDQNLKKQKILDVISKDEWIIDGTYTGTLMERMEKSDLIIFLDYSSISRVKSLLSRYIRLRNKEREEIPGCKETFKFKIITGPFKWKKKSRNKIIESLNKIDSNKVLIFKNRKELSKWFEQEFNDRIII